jgi:WD40 repeat protein
MRTTFIAIGCWSFISVAACGTTAAAEQLLVREVFATTFANSQYPIEKVTVSEDGKWLSVSIWETLTLYEVATGKEKASVGTRDDVYRCVAFCGSDTLLATYLQQDAKGQYTAGTALLSIPDLKPVKRFENRHIKAVAPDNHLCLCELVDVKKPKTLPTYELWDLKAEKTLQTLDLGKYMELRFASFRSDGQQLAVDVGIVGAFRRPPDLKLPNPRTFIFDTATGKRLAEIETQRGRTAISPDGSMLAVASGIWLQDLKRRRDALWFWDTAKKQVILPVGLSLNPRDTIFAAHYLPDGKDLVVVGTFGVGLLDLKTEKMYDIVEGDMRDTPEVSFVPTSEGIFVIAFRHKSLRIWKVTAPKKKP